MKYKIEKALYRDHANNYIYSLFNVYIFGWESDFFTMRSMSKYSSEFEIKISRSDFRADFKKTCTWGTKKKHDILLDDKDTYKPHKFYFVCPEGLINGAEINEKYGLIYMTKQGLLEVKSAKFLHKENLMNNKKFLRSMLNKFYYNNLKLRNRMDLREWDLKYGQNKLDI